MNQQLQITDLKLKRFRRALERRLDCELKEMNERILDHVFNRKREIDPNDLALHNYIMSRTLQTKMNHFSDFL